jgi:3-mercaptopyruvate sulfurtransferase SseA
MMPSVARLEAAFRRHGVGPGTRVVLYSIGTMMWATRFWWMLRSLSFDDAAVLDGGLDKWKAEGRPLETGAPRGYPPATFVAAPRVKGRGGLFVDAAAVKAAIGRSDTVTVNALGPQFHRGLEPSRYGRPGRVPGSVNVPAATLVDPATKGFIPLADAAASSPPRGCRRTSARSAIAAAASQPQSTCSCCTNSATTTSRSTTPPWASGRRRSRCRSRRTDRGPFGWLPLAGGEEEERRGLTP